MSARSLSSSSLSASPRRGGPRLGRAVSVGAALVLAGIMGSAASGGPAGAATSVHDAGGGRPATGRIATARDGKFEFTVSAVRCAVPFIGTRGFGQRPVGQYCLVRMTVSNVGDAAQSLFADNQYLFDDRGRKFTADSTASVYTSDEAQTIYQEINPGDSVTGTVYYDVPKSTRPARLELHDSASSDGVEVSLS